MSLDTSSKIGSRGPSYFNNILGNKDFCFIDDNGVDDDIKMPIYTAIRYADGVVKELLGRVTARYKYYQTKVDRKDLKECAALYNKQFERLVDLSDKVNNLVLLLKGGLLLFDSNKKITEIAIITTKEDLSATISKLEKLSGDLRANYLSRGLVGWRLADYIRWFNRAL